MDAAIENLPEVLSFIELQLEEMDCPLKAQMRIAVAAEEVFVNIASYAYAPGSGQATVGVELEEGANQVRLTFVDSGMPFDPLQKEDPDVSLPAEERQIGGLGIFMTKKTMDDVRYEYKDGKNNLTLIKKL